jgi:hypothetical protein
MTAEEILLLDNEVCFLVNLKHAARRSGNKELEQLLTVKLNSVLPRKVSEIQLAFSCASQDFKKETAVKAAQYCGRTV